LSKGPHRKNSYRFNPTKFLHESFVPRETENEWIELSYVMLIYTVMTNSVTLQTLNVEPNHNRR
jgi:hypothetical protein